MPKVGIRELKNDASAIIRAVREENAEYIVTHRGEPVAVITPVEPELDAEKSAGKISYAELKARLDSLAVEIAAKWQSDKSAVELLSEQRR